MPSIIANLSFSHAFHKIERLRVYYSRKLGRKITKNEILRMCVLHRYDELFDPTYEGYKPDSNYHEI